MANFDNPSPTLSSKRHDHLGSPAQLSAPPITVLPSNSEDVGSSVANENEVNKGGEQGGKKDFDDNENNAHPPTPMDISICQENATMMMEASVAFNKALKVLQQEENKSTQSMRTLDDINKTASKHNESYGLSEPEKKNIMVTDSKNGSVSEVPERESNEELKNHIKCEEQSKSMNDINIVSSQQSRHSVIVKMESDTSAVKAQGSSELMEQDENESKAQHHLFKRAAKSCGNSLVASFLKLMQKLEIKSHEVDICLVLFVDMDKSSKLITAFDIAAQSNISIPPSNDLEGKDKIKLDHFDDKTSINNDKDKDFEERSVKKRKIEMDMSNESLANSYIEKNTMDEVVHNALDENKENNIKSNASLAAKYNDAALTESSSNEITMTNDFNISSKSEKRFKHEELVSLFKCFLTSILCCINFDHDQKITQHSSSINEEMRAVSTSPKSSTPVNKSTTVSPDFESKKNQIDSIRNLDSICRLTSQQETQINNLASFASKQLLSFTQTCHTTNEDRRERDLDVKEQNFMSSSVTFEDFGDWYNSGGFELMPWLELLDLAKWQSLQKTSKESHSNVNSVKEEMQNSLTNDAHATPTVIKNKISPDTQLSSTHKMKNESNTKSPDKEKRKKKQASNEIMIEETDMIIDEEKWPPKTSSKYSPQLEPLRDISRAMDEKSNTVLPSSAPSSRAANISRSIVSFDFTSSMPGYYNDSNQPFCIDITEENLRMLKKLVVETGLSSTSPNEVCNILLRHSYHGQMNKNEFVNCIRELFPASSSCHFQQSDLITFSNLFIIFFSCFDSERKNVVNVRELAVGFSFLCDGKKSKKLAISFDLMDTNRKGYLSAQTLSQYLRSYLTMLVGISYLRSSSLTDTEHTAMDRTRADMIVAVDCGAQRTQRHVMKSINENRGRMNHISRANDNYVTFEEFAEWYTVGGYTVAPWLELLDLKKFLSLLESSNEVDSYDPLTTTRIGEPSQSALHPPPFKSPAAALPSSHDSQSSTSHMTREHLHDKLPDFDKDLQSFGDSHLMFGQNPYERTMCHPKENILFAFPLAHKGSLVVTRDDALYVNTIVENLSLLSFEPEDIWSTLYNYCLSSSNPKRRRIKDRDFIVISQNSFIYAIEDMINRARKKRIDRNAIEALENLHMKFDFPRDGYVPINELMGGLTLLCGGRKSAKLAFAFGLFKSNSGHPKDRSNGTNNESSLDREDLYTFFKSFLTVLFCCCAQSIDLSSDQVRRDISDTAQMVCSNVMKHQWQRRRLERITFDDFGDWYNEGGYDVAPWLELLDLNKWLKNASASKYRKSEYNEKNNWQDFESDHNSRKNSQYYQYQNNSHTNHNNRSYLQHRPHEEHKHDMFDHKYHMDESNNQNNYPSSSTFSNHQRDKPSTHKNNCDEIESNSLKFNLLTSDKHKGHVVSISQKRVSQIRHLVIESDLYRMDTAATCNRILNQAVRSSEKKIDDEALVLREDGLHHIIRSMIDYCSQNKTMSADLQRKMSDTFMLLYQSYQRDRRLEVDAYEFACGFSIFCGGKKNHKLEYAFDLLDQDKDGKLSRRGMFKYLRAFLTVVMALSISAFGRTFGQAGKLISLDGDYTHNMSITEAIDAGAAWATDQVFMLDHLRSSNSRDSHFRQDVSFDDFAEWYTRGGYKSIPWLELLDLKKWVLMQK